MGGKLVSRRQDLEFEWSLRDGVAPGLVGIRLAIRSRGPVDRVVATGRFWIFAAGVDVGGSTEARAAGRWVALPARRAFLVPPRSLLRLRVTDVRLEAFGLAGTAALPAHLAAVPSVCERGPDAPSPSDLDGVVDALRGAMRIEPDSPADGIAPRARALLVDAAGDRRPVHDAALRLGVAPETVSRSFQAAYGLTPKKYVHRLRVSDAVLGLLAGRGVLAAGFEAGFGDAGRFYDLFGRATGNTPGQYASLADQKSRGRAPAARRR